MFLLRQLLVILTTLLFFFVLGVKNVVLPFQCPHLNVMKCRGLWSLQNAIPNEEWSPVFAGYRTLAVDSLEWLKFPGL